MVLKKKVGIYSVNDKEELAVLISNHLEIFWNSKRERTYKVKQILSSTYSDTFQE